MAHPPLLMPGLCEEEKAPAPLRYTFLSCPTVTFLECLELCSLTFSFKDFIILSEKVILPPSYHGGIRYMHQR